jgi:hypothetical protein
VTLVENTTVAVKESAAVNRELLLCTRNMHTSVTALVHVMQTSPCQTAVRRTPSDRLVLDPSVEEAIRQAQVRQEHMTPVPPPATAEIYEPHPSQFEIPGPGEPPKTPRPVTRKEAQEQEERRRRAQ